MLINIIFKKDANQNISCTDYKIKNNCLYIEYTSRTEIFPLENIKKITAR